MNDDAQAMSAVPDSDATEVAEVLPQPSSLLDLSDTTEVLLVRHGRSGDIVPGTDDSVDPPLHEIGVAQAAALADRLAQKRIDAIYSSHLRRAVETARALAEPRGMDIAIVEDMQEVVMGDWARGEGRRRRAAGDPRWVAFARSGRWDELPSSEGDASLRARVTTAIDAAGAGYRGRSIAVVCHGGVINAYLAEKLGIQRSFFIDVANTSVTVVHVGDGTFVPVVIGDCHHLHDPALRAHGQHTTNIAE